MFLAERVGFEPTERFPVHSISSAANSTTLAPLQHCRFPIAHRRLVPVNELRFIEKGQSEITNWQSAMFWRRGWDLNPRWSFPHSGFRDRCTKPLCDLSAIKAKGKSKKGKNKNKCPCSCWLARLALPRSAFPFTFLLLPSNFKELLHQLAALRFQNASDHFDAMIQLIGVADMKVRFDCSGLFVRRAINQKRDPRLDQCARAHGARLDCRIDGGVCQPVIAKLPGRFAQGHDLGVRRRITIGARAISRHGQQFIAVDDASSDGNFSGSPGLARGSQRLAHPMLVRREWA